MSYITASEYADITGGDESDATEARIKRASRLLDVRIGNWKRSGEFKLTLSALEEWQRQAVKDWVAWMIKSLTDNNDSIEVNETVRLGRFSATKRDKNELVPDDLVYADQVLKDSGMIKLGVPYKHSPTHSTVING